MALHNVLVEHLLSSTSGKGLVKLTAVADDGVEHQGQIDPAAAREIAANLALAAARAEYEEDFATAARNSGMPEDGVIAVLGLIRHGEIIREAAAGAARLEKELEADA